MIRLRWLVAGALAAACGWQLAARMYDHGSPAAGAVMIVLGAILVAASARESRLALIATVVVGQALALPAVIALLARVHELPFAAPLVAGALRLIGADATVLGSRVVIGGAPIVDFLPSLSRLGAFQLLLTLAALLAVALLLPLDVRRRECWLVIPALLGFAFVRIVVLLALRLELPMQGFDTNAVLQTLTLLPAVLFLPRAVPLADVSPARSRLRLAAACAAGLAWALALGFVDRGVPKQHGRVAIDDGHGPWEPTDTPFRADTYGQRLSYAYSSLYRLLSLHYDVARLTGPIAANDLRGVGVLIVKTPTQPFAPEEIDAIDQFVRDGGGLFLIGDHTNLFGMTSCINPVAERFGIAFQADDTYALATEEQSRWEPWPLSAHPVARGIGPFEFETSCTLDVPLASDAVMIGYGLGYDTADYSRPGFFGNLHLDDRDDYGFFVQHALVPYGRGRVAAFSDSTTFSNFSLFFPGRTELLLGTVEFLNRRATPLAATRPAAAVLALLALVVFVPRRGSPRDGGIAALAAGASFVVAMAVLAAFARPLPLPPLREPVKRVAFDVSLGTARLPSVLSDDPKQATVAMDTFLVASQRLGHLPFVSRTFDESLAKTAAVVLVQPAKPSDEQLRSLVDYVSRGGSLLVVDGLLARGTGTEEVLRAFDMNVTPMAQRVAVSGPSPLVAWRPLLAVSGGTRVLSDADGNALYSETSAGRGRVGVLVDAYAVSKASLGSRFIGAPSEQERANAELAYFVLRRMVDRNAAPSGTAVAAASPPEVVTVTTR